MKNVPHSQQLTVEQALSRAKKAIKQGDTAVALQLYNAVLQQQPNHPIAKKKLRKIQKGLVDDQAVQMESANPPHDQISSLVNLYQQGQLLLAEQACKELLQAYPQSLTVMNVFGATLQRQGKLQQAVASFEKAIQLKPDFAEAHSNRGSALKELGHLDEAVASYNKAIQLKPDFAEAYSNRGNALQDLGQLQGALADHDKAIQLNPEYAEAYSNRGHALRALGQFGEAVANHDKAIQLKPDFATAYSDRGNALAQLGQPQNAITSYDKAIQLKPDFAEAYSNRGKALQELGRLVEAVASYDKAIEIKPEVAETFTNRGNALKQLGQLNKSVSSHEKAIQINPNFATAYSNRGIALQDLGRLHEAVASYEKAIRLQPDIVMAYSNRGNVLEQLGLFDEAVKSYRDAIQIEPDCIEAYNNLLMTLNYIPNYSAIERLAIAREFGEIVTEKAQARFSTYHCPPMPDRLRVGFISGDLRNHSVGHFLENILSSIDSSKLELIAYPTTPKVDALSERIKLSFSSWKPIYGQTDEEVAKLIHADGIHVLLDLSGHTAANRLPVFAFRPAPVQVSWLGYFATTGLDEMDYLLGDPYVTPLEKDEQFTEKVWRLPETRWCFTPPGADVEVSIPPALRQGYVTFGCFNNFSKLNDKVVELWAKVLKAIPNSQLVLKCKQFRDPLVRKSVIQRFSTNGINNERITLEGPEDRQSYFAAYNRIDIALDPFPFTGGTTSVDALWMGVPFVTLAGNSLVSRQGVGVLINAGLPDWIADDEEEYLAKAVLFASDLDKLAKLRRGLRSQVLASPLFDASRFARSFEHALLEMWDQQATREGSTETSEKFHTTVLQQQPNHSVAIKSQRKLQESSAHNQAAQMETANPPQDQINKLVNLYQSKQLLQTEQACREVLQTYPQALFVINVLGAALRGQGKLQQAVASYDEAIQIKPDFAEAYNNRGYALADLGELQEAVASYDKAIQIKPDFAEAHSNRGNALKDLGQLEEAVSSHNKAIQISPDLAGAHSNRGNALKDLGLLLQAMASFERAIQLAPDYAEAYLNRANILKDLGQLHQALAGYDKAIQLMANYAMAYSNRGNVLIELGQIEEAVASCEKAIELNSDHTEGYNILLMALNYTSNNSEIDRVAIARKFGEIVAEKARGHVSAYQCQPAPDRLRVGFVSGDLNNHPVGFFLESILSSINSSKLELIAYPTTPIADDLSERITPFFSKWKPIYSQKDEAAANLIVADGVHVLVDLSGHTAGNRLSMFAYKPSPVQVSWLGYFATTGLDDMDYLLGDPYVTPPEDDGQFTEKVWRLPETRWCFTPPSVDVEVSVPPALKRGYVTFGCFNNFSKLNDQVVALWAKVLKAIPDSQLLLKNKQFRDQALRESVLQKFSAEGINSERISLEGPEERLSYFAAYNRIDIALDPFPFTGGATSVEGLWMGVPLISLAGDSLVSRQGVGVLMNAGLPDWIADDEEEYCAKAILFASDLDKLASLRSGLRSQVLASPLFDASRFARSFEHALMEMWNQRAIE